MPAPAVWAAIVGGAALIGLAFDALLPDEDAREAVRAAGVNPDTDPADLTPDQIAAISEEMAKLPPETQQAMQTQMQQEVQQARQSTGTTDLAGLSGELDPAGQEAAASVDGTPESTVTHEGHTFVKDPPTPESAADRPRDPLIAQQFVSQGPSDEVSEQELVTARAEAADDITSYQGHTPSGKVLPYIAALHDWATEEGRSVEGLYRQRYYRQEMLRLNRELQTRTARTPNALAISPTEASLREFFEREGTLSPWEQRDPLSFTEEELTAPASSVSGLTTDLPDRGDAPGAPGDLGMEELGEFEFAPFADIADRDDLLGSVVDTDGVLALLAQSNSFFADDARLSRIDQSGQMAAPNAKSVYVRRDKQRRPEYLPYDPRERLFDDRNPDVAAASSFEVGEQALIDQIHRMGQSEVENLQTALWKAGFFGDNIPTRGQPDGLTVQAMQAAIDEAARYRQAGEVVTLEEVIERRQEHWAGRLGELASGARGLSQQTVQVALEDPAALQELMEQASIQTIGAANLNEAQVQSFIGSIHQAQRQQAAERVQRRNQALEQWQPETPWDDPPEEAVSGGGVVESVSVAPGARAEDFVEAQRPAEAGATQFANTYGSFLDLIRGGTA